MPRRIFQKSLQAILILAILFIGFTPQSHADVLMDGYKQVVYGVKLEGIKDFPDYAFILYLKESKPIGWGGYTVLSEDKVVRGYWNPYLYQPKIYAIKKSKFHENEIGSMGRIDKDGELKSGYYLKSEAEQIFKYFNTNKNLIPADVVIEPLKGIKESDPRDEVIDLFKVDSIRKGKLDVSQVPEEAKVDSGEKHNTTSSNKPAARLRTGLELIWYAALPILALLATIIIVLKRRPI